MSIVDLAPRDAGLIPVWFLPAGAALWAGLLWLARGRLAARWPGLAAEVVAAGALGLAHLLFFWRPLLTPAQVPRGGGDLASFFFPLHAFAADQVRHGVLPLWNPHLHGGMPHLANFQAATLYPPNLLAYLVARPFSYGALELLALAHYLVASIGAYALARSLGLRPLAAVVPGIVFPYSGFLVAHLGHYSMLAAAAWVPLLLLTLRLTALRASWPWAAAAAVVVFLMTSAGHQQTLLYALTAAGAWWLFWAAVRHGLLPGMVAPVAGGAGGPAAPETVVETAPAASGRLRRRPSLWPLISDAVRAALAMGTGLALAAPMVLPSLELARRSVRTGLSYEQASELSVQPVALLHLLVPKAFGSNPTDYWGPFSNGEIWAYVGITTLVLAGLALAARPEPVRLLLGGAVVVALLYALGPATPLHGWGYRFAPFYDLLRAPARALLYVDLGLALLAGFGLHELAGRAGGLAQAAAGAIRAALRVVLAGLAALALVVIPLFYAIILSGNDLPNRPVIAVDGLNLLLLYLALTGALLWAVLRGRVGGVAAGALAIALIVVDLFGATASFNPSPDDLIAGFRNDDAVAYLRTQAGDAGPVKIESATLRWQPNLAALVGLSDIGGLFDPMQPRDYDAARRAAVANRGLPLYQLLGARFLITDAEAEPPGPAFRRVHQTADGLAIWEHAAALPRAWLAYSAQPVDRDAALAAIRRPDFAPRTTLYLTGDLPPAEPGGAGTATVTDVAANSVSVRVRTDRPAYLVLADLMYPGWVATIDGQPTPIATADGLFRAVTVPAGEHEVVFRFQPPLVRAGTAIALVAILVLGGMIALGVRQRRAAPTPSPVARG
ncbi:MAG: YfhO family protein [Sphaerobacter sp.]|nr:YfhO family protein [Sphaerobacter sp.]